MAAEPAAPALPRFEFASVKPSEAGGGHPLGLNLQSDTVEIYGVNARTLVEMALNTAYSQVTGTDALADKEMYDIVATLPEDFWATMANPHYTWFSTGDTRLNKMLLSLLIDRFHLQYHRETRTGDVYLLERNGKLLAFSEVVRPWANHQSPDTGLGTVGYAGAKWAVSATSMPQLARFASEFIFHTPVFDQTGLNGWFNYRQIEPDLEPRYSGDQSDSFVHFLSEAGLKLEKSRGPVETVVIDRLFKPTSN
jgi:uncharacterized protein (TIGR03435 family)